MRVRERQRGGEGCGRAGAGVVGEETDVGWVEGEESKPSTTVSFDQL